MPSCSLFSIYNLSLFIIYILLSLPSKAAPTLSVQTFDRGVEAVDLVGGFVTKVTPFLVVVVVVLEAGGDPKKSFQEDLLWVRFAFRWRTKKQLILLNKNRSKERPGNLIR